MTPTYLRPDLHAAFASSVSLPQRALLTRLNHRLHPVCDVSWRGRLSFFSVHCVDNGGGGASVFSQTGDALFVGWNGCLWTEILAHVLRRKDREGQSFTPFGFSARCFARESRESGCVVSYCEDVGPDSSTPKIVLSGMFIRFDYQPGIVLPSWQVGQ